MCLLKPKFPLWNKYSTVQVTLHSTRTPVRSTTNYKENIRLLICNYLVIDTKFVATVSPSLKKEAVVSIVDIYRQFVTDSARTQDRITVIQHISKYVCRWRCLCLLYL